MPACFILAQSRLNAESGLTPQTALTIAKLIEASRFARPVGVAVLVN